MSTGDEYTFIGFDCAYRKFGWCVLGWNPRGFVAAGLRALFVIRACGVEDFIPEGTIASVSQDERARRLARKLNEIAPVDCSRVIIVIEKQPGRQGRGAGIGNVHAYGNTIEAQLTFYFNVVRPAWRIVRVSPRTKNHFAEILLDESAAGTYSARKKQVMRAYAGLGQIFDFGADRGLGRARGVNSDKADACVQIIAAIFLDVRHISGQE